MRNILLAALILLTAGCANVPVAPADPAPEAAVFVTTCHQIVVAVIAMPDGKISLFDGKSETPADDVKILGSQSRQPARVYEVGCYKDE